MDVQASLAAGRRLEIKSRNSVARSVLLVLFWLWGVGAGAGMCHLILKEPHPDYQRRIDRTHLVTMQIVFWIGGMVLFGIGTMTVRKPYEIRLIDEKRHQ